MDIFGKVFNEVEYNEKRVSRLFRASEASSIEKAKIPFLAFSLSCLGIEKQYHFCHSNLITLHIERKPKYAFNRCIYIAVYGIM